MTLIVPRSRLRWAVLGVPIAPVAPSGANAPDRAQRLQGERHLALATPPVSAAPVFVRLTLIRTANALPAAGRAAMRAASSDSAMTASPTVAFLIPSSPQKSRLLTSLCRRLFDFRPLCEDDTESGAKNGESAYGDGMSPLTPSSQLADALAPPKLRKDGIRLGLVALLSVVYTLVFEQRLMDVLLVVLNGFGVLVGALALIFAFVAIRRHGRAAVIALAVYGACTAGHAAAIVLLLRN